MIIAALIFKEFIKKSGVKWQNRKTGIIFPVTGDQNVMKEEKYPVRVSRAAGTISATYGNVSGLKHLYEQIKRAYGLDIHKDTKILPKILKWHWFRSFFSKAPIKAILKGSIVVWLIPGRKQFPGEFIGLPGKPPYADYLLWHFEAGNLKMNNIHHIPGNACMIFKVFVLLLFQLFR